MMSHEQAADKSLKSLPVGTANLEIPPEDRVWGTDVTITVASPGIFTTTVPPKPDAVESHAADNSTLNKEVDDGVQLR